ncbi:MAG: cytochrome c oxidase subunit II [Chloroflexi bacterium]|nr:cytochrome c oxidase subunit II [Chloroflexota bacterium]
MNKQKHLYTVSGLVVIGAIAAYIVLRALYKLPIAASAEAGSIDTMFTVYFGLIAFFFALIMVFMLYAAFVFKREPGDMTDAAHIHGNTTLEIVWTVIPFLIVLGLGIWGMVTFNDLVSAKENEIAINVTGSQWSWNFEYPEHNDVVSPQLYLPINQPVVLKMTATDVLHSFWVPEFRVKQDLVPGYEQELRFEPTEIGSYKVRCAEICGLDHTSMVADVRVVSQSEFDAWVTANSIQLADMTQEERGEYWFSGGKADWASCAGCHSLDGSPKAGPTWLGVYGSSEELEDGTTITVDEEYIRKSILDPNSQIVADFPPAMPDTFEEPFAAKEAEILAEEGLEIDIIADLIAFMQTLEE